MLKLTAEKMLYGGFALARTDKGVVFVEGLLPGETALCSPAGKQGGVKKFKVETFETSSPARREPTCKHYGTCGGCNWLHMEYDEQLKAKRDIFDDAMTRIGKLESYPEPEIISGDEFGYRQRVQFKINRKQKVVGFFKRSSNEITAIDSCPLLTDSLNELLNNPNDFLKIEENKRGCMVIDTGKALLSKPVIEGKSTSVGTINVGSFSFKLKGDSFFQSNRYLTENMASWCSEELQGKRLLDLFGGVGLFSLFHGQNFDETVLVELSKAMARSAEKGFHKNGLKNAKALGMSSEQFFKQTKTGYFDSIIVDPPREGLSKEVRQGILKLQPEKLLYISCNPTTQARDLGELVQNGYKIVKTALFDLYPNTSHMESGAFLVKE